MKILKTGFAVIYRWQVKAGFEKQFKTAWATITELLIEKQGARGSRLHQTEEGIWVAYAQWPSKQAWVDSQNQDSVDAEVSRQMAETIQKRFDPILLHPVDDYLMPE